MHPLRARLLIFWLPLLFEAMIVAALPVPFRTQSVAPQSGRAEPAEAVTIAGVLHPHPVG
jgi:hypothetical protein